MTSDPIMTLFFYFENFPHSDSLYCRWCQIVAFPESYREYFRWDKLSLINNLRAGIMINIFAIKLGHTSTL